ncbi:PilX N-terminal domain-containing pilus assembly protein [Acidovorax sp. Leaf78]|uniref:pilus assembly PilX family protein n=1 Tax=unclassified Acidovorax TaxID=2684926 RepID=UPI000A51B464|nr:PilX N-terminal domain-containing pilus assembly protein [Acidovorax sp. Leaf78]
MPIQIKPSFNRRRHAHTQSGVALFVVIVFVMLSMLLALWASRTSLFNELVVGNDADYQRAFEAAQALLQDAELDIRGEGPDGNSCAGANCRDSLPAAYKIPLEKQEVTPLLADLDQQSTKCRDGLCTKRDGRQDFWNTISTTPLAPGEAKLSDMTQPNIGARYGQYSGAATGNSSTPANPILADVSSNNSGGWYWIEIMQYDESSKNSRVVVDSSSTNLLRFNLKPNVIYRITALAYGRKPGTMAVLQQTYVRQVKPD